MSNALIVTIFAHEFRRGTLMAVAKRPTSCRRVILDKSRKGGSAGRGAGYPLRLIRALLAWCR